MVDIISRLQQQYGRLGDIPDRVLRENDLQRIVDVQTATHVVVHKAAHVRLKQRATSLIESFAAYLSPSIAERLERFTRDERTLPEWYLTDVEEHVQQFIQAGLPRIYAEFAAGTVKAQRFYVPLGTGVVLEVSTRFPTIDYVISFAIGEFENRRRWVGAMLAEHGKRQDKMPIPPCRAIDVLRFCRLAFNEDGKISKHLIEEVVGYSEEHFDFRSADNRVKATQHTRDVIDYLERMLSATARTMSRTYEQWDGTFQVFGERCWYLRFDPSEREALAERYYASLTRVPVGADRVVYDRIRVLFAANAPTESDLIEREKRSDRDALERIVKEALESGKYHTIPMPVFWDNMFPEHTARILDHFRILVRALGQGEDPGKIFTSTKMLHELLDIPAALPGVPAFKDVLDEEKLAAAQGLSDERFAALFMFGGPYSRSSTMGVSAHRQGVYPGIALNYYIGGRKLRLARRTKPK